MLYMWCRCQPYHAAIKNQLNFNIYTGMYVAAKYCQLIQTANKKKWLERYVLWWGWGGFDNVMWSAVSIIQVKTHKH